MLKVALAGCGRVAEKHLKALRFQEKKGRVKLCAVCDMNRASAEALLQRAVKGRFRAVPVYESFESMLAEVRPDIVAVTTPSGTHRELALKALEQGCHLLAEKPLAMTLEDCEAIVQAAEKADRRLAMGHIYRYFPCVAELERALREGRYGRVLYGTVQVRWGHDQAYYDSAPWRGTRAADGGVVMNQSVHALDLMAWLLGAEGSYEVKAFCDRQTHEMESEDLGLALFRYANGPYLAYEGTTSTGPGAQEAAFFIACEKADIRARLFRKKISFSILTHEGKEEKRSYLISFIKQTVQNEGWSGLTRVFNPHTAIWSDLIRAVEEKRAPLADVHAGRDAVAMVEAVYKACGIQA